MIVGLDEAWSQSGITAVPAHSATYNTWSTGRSNGVIDTVASPATSPLAACECPITTSQRREGPDR